MATQSWGGWGLAGGKGLRVLLLSLTLGVLGTVLLLSLLVPHAVVSAPEGGRGPGNLSTATSASRASDSTTSVHITKTVEPSRPDTGGTVSICFTIERPGLDVVLVQDVSGSMGRPAGGGGTRTRLEASQVAASAFVGYLPGTDRAAVVPYSTTAYLAEPLTTARGRITGTIYGLAAAGWTNVGAGISVSHRALITISPRSEAVRAAVLLSDGNANCDERGWCGEDRTAVSAEYALERAGDAAAADIRIYTVGFGEEEDVNTDLLKTIAITTGGEYYFAPDGDALRSIYLTIALELHGLVINDVLTPGVEAGGAAAVTVPVSDSLLISNPLSLCFTATVNLDPGYEGPINGPGSGFCYQDSRGRTVCDEFVNPPVVVGGRKITGHVFYDVDADGHLDADEAGAPDVVVRTSTGVTAVTGVGGGYVLCASSEPTIAVAVEVPPGYVATTPVSRNIPPATGVYTVDFGIRAEIHLPVVARNYPPPINGGFEDGWTGWMHGGKLDQGISPDNPHSGSFSALLGDPDYRCEDGVPIGSTWVEQAFRVPSTASPELSFWYNIFTHDKNSDLGDTYDSFDVRVNGSLVFRDMNTTNPYKCKHLRNLGWRPAAVDLSGYRGSYVTVRFENWNRYDHWYNTWTYVDDVRVNP
jgi:Mg-chelatase subunit ChlD